MEAYKWKKKLVSFFTLNTTIIDALISCMVWYRIKFPLMHVLLIRMQSDIVHSFFLYFFAFHAVYTVLIPHPRKKINDLWIMYRFTKIHFVQHV